MPKNLQRKINTEYERLVALIPDRIRKGVCTNIDDDKFFNRNISEAIRYLLSLEIKYGSSKIIRSYINDDAYEIMLEKQELEDDEERESRIESSKYVARLSAIKMYEKEVEKEKRIKSLEAELIKLKNN